MANTTVVAASVVEKWESKFFVEYIRENRFARYMGSDENSIIQVNESLSKQAGDKVNIPLITKLQNTETTGTDTLSGNEEAQSNYNHQITVNMRRSGTKIDVFEQFKTVIDFGDAARTTLKMRAMESVRDLMLDAIGSPVVDGKTKYADATAAQKNTWVAAQNPAAGNHRVLFGAVTTNYSASDHATSLSNVDSTSDKLSPTTVSLMKRLALKADPGIRPVRVDDDEEWFVLFAGLETFRDLNENSTMQQANRDGWVRGKDNPLFKAGDLIWDGVIIRQVPEIAVITGVGAASIDVGPVYLCGAQALGYGIGQRPKLATEDKDYGHKKGVEISRIDGVEKLTYNNVQHGVVTGYFSGVAD